jgi:protein Mpv17
MSVFFSYLGLCNGDSVGAIGSKIKNDLFAACQGSWKVWPIVHAVNFKFISTKHRLVFINGVQIAFNMFLSLIGTK